MVMKLRWVKMTRLKRSSSTAILAVCAIILITTNAVTATSLPSSSYYEGRSYFYENGLAGYVDFAVYDTQTSNEFVNTGYQVPGQSDERFIYAYQIYCNEEYSTGMLSYFAISGIGENAISSDEIIGSVEDLPESGVGPDKSYFNNSKTKAIWEFGNGYLIGGEHSWILVYTSEEDYTTGTYEVLPASDNELPVANNPEPSTIALLGLGGYYIVKRRKKSRIKTR